MNVMLNKIGPFTSAQGKFECLSLQRHPVCHVCVMTCMCIHDEAFIGHIHIPAQ